MHIPTLMKYSSMVCLAAWSIKVVAQPLSYIYIQGDKQTPFYVKIDSQMMPRYGKNYNIISELSPGLVHVQILFQQRVFPPENFTIDVPENGYRGFLLHKKENGFDLYDLQQKTFLQPTEN